MDLLRFVENILHAAANEINVIKEKIEMNSVVIQNRNRNRYKTAMQSWP